MTISRAARTVNPSIDRKNQLCAHIGKVFYLITILLKCEKFGCWGSNPPIFLNQKCYFCWIKELVRNCEVKLKVECYKRRINPSNVTLLVAFALVTMFQANYNIWVKCILSNNQIFNLFESGSVSHHSVYIHDSPIEFLISASQDYFCGSDVLHLILVGSNFLLLLLVGTFIVNIMEGNVDIGLVFDCEFITLNIVNIFDIFTKRKRFIPNYISKFTKSP